MKIEWLVVPKNAANCAHAFEEGSKASVCGRVRNLESMTTMCAPDWYCSHCQKKVTK